jgi:hypothetical protein
LKYLQQHSSQIILRQPLLKFWICHKKGSWKTSSLIDPLNLLYLYWKLFSRGPVRVISLLIQCYNRRKLLHQGKFSYRHIYYSSSVHVSCKRCGGAYGGKAVREGVNSTACAVAAYVMNRFVLSFTISSFFSIMLSYLFKDFPFNLSNNFLTSYISDRSG